MILFLPCTLDTFRSCWKLSVEPYYFDHLHNLPSVLGSVEMVETEPLDAAAAVAAVLLPHRTCYSKYHRHPFH